MDHGWAGPYALPNLVLIGAMKCGTSALHAYLDMHPQIAMSRPKELNFFIGPDPGNDGDLRVPQRRQPTAGVRRSTVAVLVGLS